MWKLYYKALSKVLHSFHYRVRRDKNLLADALTDSGKTKWLDIGSSVSNTDNFFFCDILEISEIPEVMRERYFQWNATQPLTEEQIKNYGTFDFIRLQHVYEHFTPEDGIIVLQNIFKLLNSGGKVLITVPDLGKYVKRYRRGTLDYNWSFAEWAQTRVEKKAPQSFYFSIFTHSVPHQAHHWCYDKHGLKYQIERSIAPKKIEFLSVFDKRANIPFTHNRPLEDLCVLITK